MTHADDVASPGYRAVLRKRYESPGWGASGGSHAETVLTFAREIGAASILDYGCGRGGLKMALPADRDVREYDPGIIGKDGMPEPADLLVATDVLEHIEPGRLPAVLRHMRALARRGMFLTIAISRSKETLPDGRNAHLIIQPPEWWLTRLREARIIPTRAMPRKGLWVWVNRNAKG